jgi:amino acid transporter
MICLFNFLLGLVLAEICSAYPTSGGVYFWAHRLGGELLALPEG